MDLSVLVPAEREGALLRTLRRHGFADPVRRGAVIQAGHGSGYRLDLLLAASRFEEAVIADAEERALSGDISFRLARLEDVVAFKVVGGRPRDLRDIEELSEHDPELDWTRVAGHLRGLGVRVDPKELETAARNDDLRPLLRRMVAAMRG